MTGEDVVVTLPPAQLIVRLSAPRLFQLKVMLLGVEVSIAILVAKQYPMHRSSIISDAFELLGATRRIAKKPGARLAADTPIGTFSHDWLLTPVRGMFCNAWKLECESRSVTTPICSCVPVGMVFSDASFSVRYMLSRAAQCPVVSICGRMALTDAPL